MVIGKVSKHGSFLAPYGDFNIDESEAHEMRGANFLFTLGRPDDDSGGAFQTDFDKCISAIHSIVDHFREIKAAKPFVTDGFEGPSLNFSHKVFEFVCLLYFLSIRLTESKSPCRYNVQVCLNLYLVLALSRISRLISIINRRSRWRSGIHRHLSDHR